MSEYKPITGELRNSMTYDITTAPNGVSKASIDTVEFVNLCDAIDSIHAQLERENESLKAELDRARGEWDYWESTHIELPKDADGEPVCIGDVMEWSDGKTFAVVGIGDGTLYYLDADKDGHVSIEWTSTEQKRHHQPDTWERIIEDAIRGDGGNYGCLEERFDATVPALVARCKALAGDAE